MKKSLKILLIMIVSICMYLLFSGQVFAYNSDATEYDQNQHKGEIITKDSKTYFYKDWKKAIEEAQTGDTVKFVDYTSSIASTETIVIENKDITINWNRQNINAKFQVKNCTVNFESTPNKIDNAPLITLSDNGKAIIDGNTMKEDGNYWSSGSSALIQVGTENTTGHLIIKNVKSGDGEGNNAKCMRGKYVALVLGPDSTVEVSNSRLISYSETILVKGTNNKIDIQDSNLNQANWGGVISCEEGSKGTQINVSNTKISNAEPIELNGENITLNLDKVDINVNKEWGLGVFGKNNTVNVKNSSITTWIRGNFCGTAVVQI